MSPCSDERPGDRERDQNMREGAGLLCKHLTEIEFRGMLHLLPVEIAEWWAEHKRLDARYPE